MSNLESNDIETMNAAELEEFGAQKTAEAVRDGWGVDVPLDFIKRCIRAAYRTGLSPDTINWPEFVKDIWELNQTEQAA